MISQRGSRLKTSPTLALVAKAKELQSLGHDVISLTVGEPDWGTFEIPSRAGIEAIQKGITKYTPANGTLELRKVIAAQILKDFALEYSPNEVTVGPGAKFVIFSALAMLCDPGDEVIINAPYWVSYPTMIELADGKPIIVECDESTNFKISAKALEQAISAKTKAFLFCSPSNPTGLMYTLEELKELAQVFRRHPRVVILSDDMYNRLVFDGSKVAPHILQAAPDLRDRVVIINGGSKAYAMTGWRIGWAAGPQPLIRAMGDYQSQTTGAPSSIAQYAALAAIQACDGDIGRVVETLKQRKHQALRQLREIPGFQVVEPDGAFYLWVNIKDLIGRTHEGVRITSDKDFCDILLHRYYVATVPGVECGSPGFMRLSFAISEEKMSEACRRMQSMVSVLV
ncbi:MAG: pyridoxal phosphate-dependent aminotransferase [Bdellovibrionaceae bacterium]|nr:pyridoxal phosphate-dependent aminotransferase [Pseudobdellovibrionaceae bacterium]